MLLRKARNSVGVLEVSPEPALRVMVARDKQAAVTELHDLMLHARLASPHRVGLGSLLDPSTVEELPIVHGDSGVVNCCDLATQQTRTQLTCHAHGQIIDIQSNPIKARVSRGAQPARFTLKTGCAIVLTQGIRVWILR